MPRHHRRQKTNKSTENSTGRKKCSHRTAAGTPRCDKCTSSERARAREQERESTQQHRVSNTGKEEAARPAAATKAKQLPSFSPLFRSTQNNIRPPKHFNEANRERATTCERERERERRETKIRKQADAANETSACQPACQPARDNADLLQCSLPSPSFRPGSLISDTCGSHGCDKPQTTLSRRRRRLTTRQKRNAQTTVPSLVHFYSR